jgi:uncharacterized alkaline shock family protein YloU
MSDAAIARPPEAPTAPGTPSGTDLDLRDQPGNDLVTEHGKTSIADSVVSKVAGVAAREIDGVYAMGSTGARVIGAVRDKVGQTAHAQGVSVEVGERQAAIDLTLVVEYDVSIVDLAEGVRDNVIQRVESMTGLEVTEVNIDVVDVHIPGTDDEQEPDPRPEPPRVR